MTRTLLCLITAVLSSSPPLFAEPLDFDEARWIWSSAGAQLQLADLPAETTYFRSELEIPDDAAIASAEVIATCDNMFVLYVNGQPIGESAANNNAWGKPKRWNLSERLSIGRNVVAIAATNTLPGPAGLIAKVVTRLKDGSQRVLVSDAHWMCTSNERPNWQDIDFDDTHWNNARVVGKYGDAPWRRIAIPGRVQPAGTPVGQVAKVAKLALEEAAKQQQFLIPEIDEPGDDFPWPEALVYVGDDCSLYRPLQKTNSSQDSLTVTIFNPRNSRAFPEHDLPAPMKVGRKLYVVKPARPGVEPRELLDAGQGGLGSPSVSFDGRSILISMAYDGDPFFHVFRVSATDGKPEQLTDGPFHDVDPTELPDGRIVFTSTRIGTFEEYHNPPSRSLFVMDGDGENVQPLTHTIIFDNEPEVLADGRILFIRSDNFFDRGKVETLLHAIHTDGSEGYTEFGLDIGPDYGGRLRSFYCGSPTPMPDGRLAFLSRPGITIGRLGSHDHDQLHFRVEAGDVAALPDGRLLCTTGHRVPVKVSGDRVVQDTHYERIAILDPQGYPPTLTTLLDSPHGPLHSPVYLGARRRPAQLAEQVNRSSNDNKTATGVLFCQNAFATKNKTAGWSHVRAIRVIAGKGLTTRSSHSYIVHAGSEVTELGTVPLAPDGSFSVEVPADTPIAFQAVDAEGRSELNEMSWIYVRPGEQRGCVGCHHTRQDAPLMTENMPLAYKTPPLRLMREDNKHRFRGNNAAVTGLMELQLDRYREVAGINRYGQLHESAESGAAEITRLIAQLEHNNDATRIAASQRLSVFRDPAAAPALVSVLYDSNREVRVAATMALATCGTRESIAPLLKRLTDRDPLVAQAAAIAIENLTGRREATYDAFAERDAQQAAADTWRSWFQDTSWDTIEADLLARLEDPNRDVVRRAAVALGHVGRARAGDALRTYVMHQRDINPLPQWRSAGHRGDAARFNAVANVNPRTLQAATRALGYLKDEASIGMLAETIAQHSDPDTANLFLAEAAVEALGRIATPEAETALINAFAELGDYPTYTYWYGDHQALMACHASPVHYFVLEALDRMGSTAVAPIVPAIIRSVPIDPDRALLLCNDDYETLVGRIIRRSDMGTKATETCLALLGDPQANSSPEIEEALSTIHRCWAGHPSTVNRAAQILSMVCRDQAVEPRVRAAFQRYRKETHQIPRQFDTGIPVVDALPTKNWVCFYLARTLGNLEDSRSVDALIEVLAGEPTEAATGRPDPLGPAVLFLHNELTPCWRAAAAWALGRIGDRRAGETLLNVVRDMENATDTRHAAAEALGRIGDPSTFEAMEQLATDYPEISTRRTLYQALP